MQEPEALSDVKILTQLSELDEIEDEEIKEDILKELEDYDYNFLTNMSDLQLLFNMTAS